jgi:hypothetical protein
VVRGEKEAHAFPVEPSVKGALVLREGQAYQFGRVELVTRLTPVSRCNVSGSASLAVGFDRKNPFNWTVNICRHDTPLRLGLGGGGGVEEPSIWTFSRWVYCRFSRSRDTEFSPSV